MCPDNCQSNLSFVPKKEVLSICFDFNTRQNVKSVGGIWNFFYTPGDKMSGFAYRFDLYLKFLPLFIIWKCIFYIDLQSVLLTLPYCLLLWKLHHTFFLFILVIKISSVANLLSIFNIYRKNLSIFIINNSKIHQIVNVIKMVKFYFNK